MCDFDFSALFAGIPGNLSFLLTDAGKAAAFHKALLEELAPGERAALAAALNAGAPAAALKACYAAIDPDGFSSDCPGETAAALPALAEPLTALLAEAEALRSRYPLFIGTGRPLRSADDNEFLPSLETVLRAVSTALPDGGKAFAAPPDLLKRVYDRLARDAGYASLDDAERVKEAEDYDADFTDSLCGGEC